MEYTSLDIKFRCVWVRNSCTRNFPTIVELGRWHCCRDPEPKGQPSLRFGLYGTLSLQTNKNSFPKTEKSIPFHRIKYS